MKLKALILSLVLCLLPLGIKAQEVAEDKVNVPEIIFGHIGDSYEWHITDIGQTKVAIHLPVILHSSKTGWHMFSSARLVEAEYEGFHIDPESGKIVDADGDRPFDISITKNVLSLMISAVLMLVVFLLTARWYRKHDALNEAPTGIAAYMEPLVMLVHGIAKDSIGEDYRRYSPYLCMAFFFILFNNFLGIIPSSREAPTSRATLPLRLCWRCVLSLPLTSSETSIIIRKSSCPMFQVSLSLSCL